MRTFRDLNTTLLHNDMEARQKLKAQLLAETSVTAQDRLMQAIVQSKCKLSPLPSPEQRTDPDGPCMANSRIVGEQVNIKLAGEAPSAVPQQLIARCKTSWCGAASRMLGSYLIHQIR